MDNTLYQAPTADLDIPESEDYQRFKYSNWRGRVGRLKYLQMTFFFPLLVLIGFILLMSASLYISNLNSLDEHPTAIGGLSWVWGIGIIVILGISFLNWLWLSIQRAHDFGAKGLLALLVLVPILNLVLFFVPGDTEDNFYGALPNKATLLVKITGWLGLIGLALLYWIIIVMVANF